MKKLTFSVIKADVGSIGGHTKPSEAMLKRASEVMSMDGKSLLVDHKITYTGDDIAILMTHDKGVGATAIHQLAWKCFLEATGSAKLDGLYGAGQDLLVDAPAGNIRGAGPAVAEIEFDFLPAHRPAEAILLFFADKCGPGAYNHALWNTFCNPMKNGGLLLSPDLAKGFTFTIIDMNHKGKEKDRIIKINTFEDHGTLKLAALLRNIDRFAVEAIHSNAYPSEQIVSLSATRLHNIAGVYTGKDDPVMVMRTQKIFPAPEEAISPYSSCVYVTGDSRGSHTMSLMPVAVNTPVRGEYCNPIVSSLALSIDSNGFFSKETIDMFAGPEWERSRQKALRKSEDMREQGFFGVAMASQEEIAYTGLMKMMESLDKRFELRENKIQ